MTKTIDASKLRLSSFKRIITFGELCLTFERVIWDDEELVGVLYRDQTGQQWLVADDTNIRLELD